MSLSFIYGDKLQDIANRSETSKEDVTLNDIVSQLFALIINNPSRGTVHGQQNNSLRLQANKCSLARPLHIRKLQKRACQETLQGNHTRSGYDNIFQKEVSSLKSSLLKSERNNVYHRFNCVYSSTCCWRCDRGGMTSRSYLSLTAHPCRSGHSLRLALWHRVSKVYDCRTLDIGNKHAS